MQITNSVSLADYSTMHVGGTAAHLVEARDRMEVLEALSWAQTHGLPAIMVGGGSNILWQDAGFSGLVIINKVTRFEVFEEDALNTYLTIGAGEIWDSVVERSVQAGLTGIEALSLIPGSAGATPIQNVGAYGQEIANVLTTIEAYDTVSKDFVTLAGSDCAFGYRTSRFNTADKGRFYITAITLHLTKGRLSPPFYPALQAYFEEHVITDYTPSVVRAAVIAIRSAKLPNPTVIHNNGSFFANPLISAAKLAVLEENYPQIPRWSVGTGSFKLPAAWLIEQAGFKDYHDTQTGMATWPSQPLVLINEHATSTTDVLTFKQKIVDAVQTMFGIELKQEPELLP